jgi:hypothetical protein
MLAAAYAVGCPVAVVDPRWGVPHGVSHVVGRLREEPVHALRPAAEDEQPKAKALSG